MSLEEPNTTQIQLENIGDYAQFISQATIAHVAHVSESGEIVAFVEQHVDPNQQENIDPNQITLANFDPQQLQVEHVVFEQLPEGTQIQTLEFLPPLQQQQQQQQPVQVPEPKKADIKPPVGKGPFPCESCDKIFPKWNQLQRHMKSHEEDKPYRCSQCSLSFNMEENLKLHQATHVPPDGEPTCPECGKTFSRVASLKAHIMLHEKEETLMCTECGDEFSIQFQLDKHMQEHRREQAGASKCYPCKQCNMKFGKPALLREHMKQHYKIKASLVHRPYKRNIDRSSFHYKCQHCGKMFQKPSQLVRHNRIHTGERPYTCTICDRSFNQKGALRIHMSKHTGDKPYICDFCPHTFAQRGNLRAHIKRVHTLPEDGEEFQTFRCTECSCVFKKLGSLNAHISREHSEQTEISLPNDSGKQLITEEHNEIVINQILSLSGETNQESSNQQSEDIQTQDSSDSKGPNDILQQALENSGLPSGETDNAPPPPTTTASTGLTPIAPAPGTVISNNTVTQTVTTMTLQDSATGSIKKHIIRKVNGVRWHQCTYCAKEFKKPSDLVRHIRIHTHEKPYKCTQCFRSFAVKSTLTAHIKTHSGIKDYKCCLCNKMFSTQGSLKVHLRMHTGAKPFECPQCDKTFRTSAHRKSHITSHFKDGDMERKPKRMFRKLSKQDIGVSDIPLQEPILITDTGLIQQPPRNNLLNQYLGEAGSVDRPYKCGFCSRGYKKSSHLKQHIRSHTGEKPYKCIQCMKSFVSSGVLKAHIRTHTGVKAYKCLICDSLFTTNGSLKRHMSTHSEVRPFMCPYCQKTFKTSVNCKKHMKTHRHELALQALQQNNDDVDDDGDKDQSDIVEENSLADLVLQQTDQSATINQSDSLAPAGIQDALNTASLDQQLQQTLNHQIFGQTQFSQSLLGSGQQNFTQLNQQMGNQIQPQNVMTTQLTNQTSINNQLATPLSDTMTNQHATHLNTGIFDANSFQIQGQPLQDLNSLNFSQGVTSLTTSLPSTSMQNILPTSDVTILEAEEAETVDKDTPADPTQGNESTQKDDEDGARQYQCTECDKSYKKSSHLKQHMRSHTGERPYPCSLCKKSFISASILKAHIKTHDGAKDFTCPVCKADFTTNGSLVRHMTIHERTRSQKCPYCEESFRSHNMLKRHIKTHSDVIEEDIALNKRPKAVMALVEEEPVVEETTKEEDLITISKKILVESSSEKSKVVGDKMISTRESGEHYPKHAHQCIHCPKSFKKPSDLVRHIRIHTGEKPFKCNVCAKSFTVKSTLDSHMRTHQNSSKNYKCHVCTAMFATKGSLKVHMRLHTGAKPFKCPHCDQRFRTSGNRKSHVLQHFKSEPLKRRKPRETIETSGTIENVDLVPNDVQNVMTINQNNGSQVIAVDQSMLGAQNLLPVSLTVQPEAALTNSGLSESALATQVLQGLEGIQLQLTGNQGLQITGLDPNIFSQTVQIDANLLQQLQQQGNINITINPSLLTQTLQTADPNVIQNVHVQQDPNIIVQPMSTITVPEGQSLLTTSGAVMSDSAPNAFVVSGDGTIPTDQITVTQTSMTEVEGIDDITTVDDTNEEEDGVDLDTSLDDNLNGEDNGLLQHGINHDNLTHGSQSANINLQDVSSQVVNPVTGEKNDDELRMFKCAMCDKAFKRSGHLKEHMVLHTPEAKNRPRPPGNYKCQHCNKAFQKPSQLERHIRIHTGERPFVCDVCSKSFNQKNALQIHMKKHSGEKPHKCSYCDLSFVQKGNLKTHIKRAHHIDMVHSMNLPKFYMPATGANVNISTDGESRDEDGINYDEMADLMNVI